MGQKLRTNYLIHFFLDSQLTKDTQQTQPFLPHQIQVHLKKKETYQTPEIGQKITTNYQTNFLFQISNWPREPNKLSHSFCLNADRSTSVSWDIQNKNKSNQSSVGEYQDTHTHMELNQFLLTWFCFWAVDCELFCCCCFLALELFPFS